MQPGKKIHGKFIKRHDSAVDAARELGYNRNCITRVCAGQRSHHMGFSWMLETDYKENI